MSENESYKNLLKIIGEGSKDVKEILSEYKENGLLDEYDPVTGMTLLLYSCSLNHEAIAASLIEAGSDVNAVAKKSPRMSCLQFAAKFKGNILTNLICAGADINFRDVHNRGALASAANYGLINNVKILLDAGALPNSDSKSALYYATRNQQNPKLNAILVEARASGQDIPFLTLADADIQTLPESEEYWNTFSSLNHIDLSNNHLNILPVAFVMLPRLTIVNLKGNPLSAIPESFRSTSWTSQLREYLQSIYDASKEFLERKILLVGEEGTGKTTLLKSLQDRKGRVNVKENISTNGMAVKKVNLYTDEGWLEYYNPWKKDSLSYTVWDLGGQEVFYPSHQFFMTSQSIYIVVFNMANPDFERVDYWMNQLKNSSPTEYERICPILLVGTHRDHSEFNDSQIVSELQDKLKKRYPKQKFKGMKGVYCISSKTGEGVKELRIAIDKIARNMKIKVSPSWIALRKLLKREGKEREYIMKDEYENLAIQCHIKEAELALTTTFLKDIGNLIHFDEPRSKLSELVVLKPNWLAGLMATFVTFYNQWQKKGILQREDIAHILKAYSEGLHDSLILLMEKFGILVRLPTKDDNYTHVLIPSLLPNYEPNEFYHSNVVSLDDIQKNGIWSSKYSPKYIEHSREYEFTFLPLGFFDRVLSGTFFLNINVEHLNYWRHGILLGLKDSDTPQCCLITYRHGINKKTKDPIYFLKIKSKMLFSEFSIGHSNILLNEMVGLVEHIISCYFSRLEDGMRRYIPCLHCLKQQSFQNPYKFTYEECVKNLTSNNPIIYCRGMKVPNRAVLISHLAPDITFRGMAIINQKELGNEEDWKFLGKGGFGIVSKAKMNNEDVAIKSLLSEHENAIENYSDFRKEVQIMSVLNHPNTVKLIGITVNPLRIIVEFVEGGDLHCLLRPDKDKPKIELSWEQKCRIAFDIASGMNYLQSFNPPIVHRDLRSPNVFIQSIDVQAPICAKVADFGLSAFVAPDVGGALQTWQWLAPEILNPKSKSYDHRSDIYSYAIVLWEILTSDMPFAEYDSHPDFSKKVFDNNGNEIFLPNEHAIQAAIYQEDSLRPTIPEPVNDESKTFKQIIESCWATNPDDRPNFSWVMERFAPFMTHEIESNDAPNLNTRNVSVNSLVEFTQEECELTKSITLSNDISIPDAYEFKFKFLGEPLKMLVVASHLWIAHQKGQISIFSLSNKSGSVVITADDMTQSWRAHNGKITSMMCANNCVWTGAEDGHLTVWDTNGSMIWDTQFGECTISDMILVRDKKSTRVWVTIAETSSIFLIDPKKCQLKTRITLQDDSHCFSIIYHNEMVFAGTEKKIFIFETNGEVKGEWNAHTGPIKCLASDGEKLWSASGKTIAVWNISNEHFYKLEKIAVRKLHDSRITALKCLELPKSKIIDGVETFELKKEIWTSSYDYSVFMWDVNTIQPYYELKLKHKHELIRCVTQENHFVFLGSSYKEGDNFEGILYIYNFVDTLK